MTKNTTLDFNDLEYAGSIAIDSGQAIVGDPAYIDSWDTNKNEQWNIEGKVGEYSYFGACATTLSNNYGELGLSKAVAFTTGYGDGLYGVYVKINDDGRITKVVIDFEGDMDEA
jgi:hypothetical protein